MRRPSKEEDGCWKPDAAFINSGAIRLNADIEVGATLTRRHVEELFPFKDTNVVLVRVNGTNLRATINRAFEQRRGGGWLQASGLRVIAEAKDETWTPKKVFVKRDRKWEDLDQVGDKLHVATVEYLTRPDNDNGFDLQPEAVNCAPAPADMRQRVQADLDSRPSPSKSLDLPTMRWVCTLEEDACQRRWENRPGP